MIIARSPLRISLGGGGTDLPSYYTDHGGFLVAGAIDKYVYATVSRPFVAGIFLKYSRMESVLSVDEVKHNIIREGLRTLNLSAPQIEITSIADIPAGTGLGSSGSFTTALLKALHMHERRPLLPGALAEMACHIEMNLLGEPIGKQDQYIAAYGGLTCFTFNADGSVDAEPLGVSAETMHALEDRLLLFFTGFSREAGAILRDQNTRSRESDQNMLDNLHYVKELGFRSRRALEKGDLYLFGNLMHEHWLHKKKRSKGMTNGQIDKWYGIGMENGAAGGKLVGAGGGGFLMFLAEDAARLRRAMASEGLQEVRFRFDFDGTKILV